VPHVSVIRITDATTRLDIAKAITALRGKQQAVAYEATKAEIQTEIDALLERWDDAR
jgi:hypothetical protein